MYIQYSLYSLRTNAAIETWPCEASIGLDESSTQNDLGAASADFRRAVRLSGAHGGSPQPVSGWQGLFVCAAKGGSLCCVGELTSFFAISLLGDRNAKICKGKQLEDQSPT